MGLNIDTLKAELRKFLKPGDPTFAGFPASLVAASQKWADAYQAYASAGVDASGDALTLSFPVKFKDAIAGLSPPQTPIQAATAFGTAFTDYWTGGTFAIGALPPSGVGGTGIFASEITSVVLAVVPAGLIAQLTAEFAAKSADPAAKIDAIAAALHTATTTGVTVLISGLDTTPPGSGGPLPITNTGVVA
jgi:hypothetical protein